MLLSGYTLKGIADKLKDAQKAHVKQNRNYPLNFSLACYRVYIRSRKNGALYEIYFRGQKKGLTKSVLFNDCLFVSFNDFLTKLLRAGYLDEHLKIRNFKPTLNEIVVTSSWY